MTTEQITPVLLQPEGFDKLNALDRLCQQSRAGDIPVGEAIQTLLRAIQTEPWEPVRSRLWLLLSSAPPDEDALRFAKETLQKPDAFGRDAGAEYIHNNYPELHPWLIEFLDDSDPNVAYFAGLALLPTVPDKAVKVWLGWLERGAPHGLAEILIERIADHGDAELGKKLADRDQEEGGGTIWGAIAGRIANWHSVAYLDSQSISNQHGRSGSWIECPKCNWKHGVRSGHEGERIQCLKCQTIFNIPPLSPETMSVT